MTQARLKSALPEKKKQWMILAVLLFAIVTLSMPLRPARALSGGGVGTVPSVCFMPPLACTLCSIHVIRREITEWVGTGDIINPTYWRLTRHMRSEMTAQKIWWVSIFWED